MLYYVENIFEKFGNLKQPIHLQYVPIVKETRWNARLDYVSNGKSLCDIKKIK